MHHFKIFRLALMILAGLLAASALVVSLRPGATPPVTAALPRQLLLSDARFGLNTILANNTHRIPGIALTTWASNAQALGSKINRFSFDWQKVQPQQGTFDFSLPEEFVASDEANSFSTIAVLEHTPYWATNVATTNPSAQVPAGLYQAWNDPANVWGAFVYASAAHFKGRIAYYELWNEPDLLGGAGWAGSRADFFQLLKVGYLAVKAADPAAQVITGALNYNPTWLNDVLAADRADASAQANNYYFDAVGIHSYGRSIAPYTLGLQAHDVLRQAGIPDKPVFATELGIPVDDDPPSSTSGIVGTTPEAQAYMVESFAAALAGGIDHMLWYRASDVGQPQYWGLYKYKGQARPTTATFHLIMQYFANAQSASISIGDPMTKIVIDEGQQHVTVIWNASPRTATVPLYAQNAGGGSLVDLNGNVSAITPDAGGYYQLNLPGATNNHGATSSDFIVGGLPMIIVEGGPFVATQTPTPTNTLIPSATSTVIVTTPTPTSTLTSTPTSTATSTNTASPTATSTPTFPANAQHVYFSEGSSAPPYAEVLQLANAGSTPARVRIALSGTSGLITTTSLLALPRSLATVDIGALHLPPGVISANVSADRPVAAARALFYGVSASMSAGTQNLAADWYLPGLAGTTAISQVVTLSNPLPSAAGVLVETITTAGARQFLTTHVDAFSTRSLLIARDGKNSGIAVAVHADSPIAAEYTAYLPRPVGITGALGIFAPSRKWYAAEGYRSSSFGDFLAIYNPDQLFKAQVSVQLYTAQPALRSGVPVPYATATFTVQPDARASFDLGAIAPRGSFTMLLTSSVRIAVNRIVTFGPGKSRVAMVNAVQKTAASWVFPAGDTSSQERFAGKQNFNTFKEFITVVNPFPLRSAAVTITTTDPAGKQLRLSHISLAPGSRTTLDMQKLVGSGRHVTSVVSTNGVQVVAEQTIYFNGQWGGAGAPGIAPS